MIRKVAVIDSGVNLHHSCFKKHINKIQGISLISDSKNGTTISPNYEDYCGHGTSVNYILLEKSKCDIEIFNIRIGSNEENVPEEELIWALNYIYENIDCDIINISCSVIQCYDLSSLRNICEKLYRKGVIIVAAFDNSGAISYPAAFECVIGVDICENCYQLNQYEYINSKIINVRGASIFQYLPTCGDSKAYEYKIGSSFIVPHIINLLLQYKQIGEYVFEECLDYLKMHSIREHNSGYVQESINLDYEIKKAILFPFNKEIHNLVRYNDMLKFEILGIYDSKFLGNVGNKVTEILPNYSGREFIVNNVSSINWEDNFDTVIIGHAEKIELLTGRKYLESLIDKCVRYNKNIYSLSNIEAFYNKIKCQYYNSTSRLFAPKITKHNINPLSFSKLRRFGRPIISVMGTSRQQGKFSLQLELRKRFTKSGYHVGQLGTEPTSYLFNMDRMIPFGYESDVRITEEEMITLINSSIGEIEDKEPDIIIIGSQSQTINSYWGNILMYPTTQYSFLLASEPDVYILCVNADDDLDYILRTLKFIDCITVSKLIGLVVFPMRKMNNDYLFTPTSVLENTELQKAKERLADKLNVKVYSFNKDDIDKLYLDCINILAGGR